ncbi:MAG: 2-oxoacid:acceptor oxidoreductase family protein [bacterium]|nr:2-oxoacid:acceptor oxidoreductase family protein [bacterium]MCX7916706.1 2-oxoacid:acceptor oxidoreductase family protein [bacterium]MDW8164075.1 2-oxoacid:acceptor oxidoreductase family protein [Candidatus Omnitrophota bacterium]
MKEIFEIRWHGRGGQGAKTAALLFGDACVSTGKYIQAFPEYGPERMGAPVASFNRISSSPIRIHSGIENPDVVVVLDFSLIEQINVCEGLDDKRGILLINTPLSPEEIKKRIGFGGKVYTVDASKIAIETIGREIPNTPMMGALIKVTGILKLDELLHDTRKKLEVKFRNKPEVIEGNLKAIERAYNEVKGD